jgi:hypothetical protein
MLFATAVLFGNCHPFQCHPRSIAVAAAEKDSLWGMSDGDQEL